MVSQRPTGPLFHTALARSVLNLISWFSAELADVGHVCVKRMLHCSKHQQGCFGGAFFLFFFFGKRQLHLTSLSFISLARGSSGEDLKALLLLTVPTCLAAHALPGCSFKRPKYDWLM